MIFSRLFTFMFIRAPWISLWSAMSSTTVPHLDFGSNIGALQIGSLVGVFLFGIVTHRVYSYHRTYHNDILALKTVVRHSPWANDVFLKLIMRNLLCKVCFTWYFLQLHWTTWPPNYRLLEVGHTASIYHNVYKATFYLYNKPHPMEPLQGTAISILFAGLLIVLTQVRALYSLINLLFNKMVFAAGILSKNF